MTYYDFISCITKKKLPERPIYVFHGPEGFLKEQGINLIKSLYPEIDVLPAFKQDNYSSNSFLTELCALPFLQKKKLITLELSNDPTFRENVINDLETYTKNSSQSTILVVKTNQAHPHKRRNQNHGKCSGST